MKPSSMEELVSASRAGGLIQTGENRGDAVPGEPYAEENERGDPFAPNSASRRGRRGRLRTTLDLIRSNPTGRIALKIAVSVAGAIVVTVGIALIPLPGPGWLLVIAGLGIWAIEFHWAKRLLGFTRRHVHAWTEWAKAQSLPVRFALGAAGLVFVGTVVWLSLKYSLGIDVVARILHYLATH